MRQPVFREILAGGIVTAIGAAFSIGALRYGLGSFSQMQPGMFPFLLGVMVALTGLMIMAGSFWAKAMPMIAASDEAQIAALEDVPATVPVGGEWRALLLVCVALVVFGLTISRFGMAPAVIVLILIVGIAERERRLLQAVIVAICMAALTCAVFIYGLGMNIPVATWGL